MISPLAERAECWVITLAHSRLCCHPVLVLLYALLLTDVEFVIHFSPLCRCEPWLVFIYVSLSHFSSMFLLLSFRPCFYHPFFHLSLNKVIDSFILVYGEVSSCQQLSDLASV